MNELFEGATGFFHDLKIAEKAKAVEIQPFLKYVVSFIKWTNDGRMRHSLFLRFVYEKIQKSA